MLAGLHRRRRDKLARDAVEQHRDGAVDGQYAADAAIGSRASAGAGRGEQYLANELWGDLARLLVDGRGERGD